MNTHASPPPANPDIKRELKKHLLALPARSFEFFAGDLLVYIGLEAVSVTRYIGDGGIDAQWNLVAGLFRIPVGVQVKRHRNNVPRSDIDKFIGALSGRFSQGIFMTTANYAPGALHITNPLERFLIKNFIEYFPEEGVLQIAPQLWQELHHYEVLDALKSADEQISYYIARYAKRG